MRSRSKALLMLVLMLLAAGGAYGLRPTQRIADTTLSIELEAMIPTAFGEWREEPHSTSQIVDPQQQQTIDKIYRKTLSRTYVNSEGYRVMLSVAYGSNQSDSMQVHKPEVCYPAQGFVVHEKSREQISTPHGRLPITRIRASQGARNEPITYWTTVGDRPVESGLHKKVVEMRYGLSGKIPDGMLVRVSSIDSETESAYRAHTRFVVQLLDAVNPLHRIRFIGNSGTSQQ